MVVLSRNGDKIDVYTAKGSTKIGPYTGKALFRQVFQCDVSAVKVRNFFDEVQTEPSAFLVSVEPLKGEEFIEHFGKGKVGNEFPVVGQDDREMVLIHPARKIDSSVRGGGVKSTAF